MKRDITVWLSLVVIAVAGVIAAATGMPRHIDTSAPLLFHVLFWIIIVGAVRATVLWFQTLMHGLKHAKQENRVAVVLGHLLLGPLMAYAYYLASRLGAQQPGESG
jgi:hypothetical protein